MRGAIGEEVQRRSSLLEDREEERRREEKHADQIQPFSFVGGPVAAREQPAEKDDRDGQQDVTVSVADLFRRDRQRAGCNCSGERGEHDERSAENQNGTTFQLRCGFGRRRLHRMHACLTQLLRSEHVLQKAQRHADAGSAEAPVPTRIGIHAEAADPPAEARVLREKSGNQRTHECAEVDAHVEDGEAGVAADVLFRIQLADDDTDVWLEQPRAEDDERQPGIEGR